MSDVFVKALDPFLRFGYANPQKLKGHVHVTFQLCGVPFFKPIGPTSLLLTRENLLKNVRMIRQKYGAAPNVSLCYIAEPTSFAFSFSADYFPHKRVARI